MKLKNILVPVDFSEASRAALRAADALAGPDTVVTLLHVMPLTRVVVLDWQYVPPAEELVRLARAAEDALQAWASELRAPRVRVETTPGDPASEIIRLSTDYDLVVVGTHGRTGAARLLIGSVAERVVRGAHASVLVAR